MMLQEKYDYTVKYFEKAIQLVIIGFVLTVPLFSFSQTPIENFVNEASKTFVDTSEEYFLLYDEASVIVIDRTNQKVIKGLCQSISEEVLEQLLRNATSDTSLLLWKENSILGSRLISSKPELPKPTIQFQYSDTTQNVGVKKPDYELKRRYEFSRPIFDNNNQYALISMKYFCGTECGSGCIYLFEIDGPWKQIGKVSCWES